LFCGIVVKNFSACYKLNHLPGTPGRSSVILLLSDHLKLPNACISSHPALLGGPPVSDCWNSGWKQAQSTPNPPFFALAKNATP
jgi:hypothetical protein